MDLVSRTTWEIDIFLFSAFWYHHFFDFLNFLEFRFSISGFSHPSLVCPLMKPPRKRTITLQPIGKANSHVALKDNQVQICPSTDPFTYLKNWHRRLATLVFGVCLVCVYPTTMNSIVTSEPQADKKG